MRDAKRFTLIGICIGSWGLSFLVIIFLPWSRGTDPHMTWPGAERGALRLETVLPVELSHLLQGRASVKEESWIHVLLCFLTCRILVTSLVTWLRTTISHLVSSSRSVCPRWKPSAARWLHPVTPSVDWTSSASSPTGTLSYSVRNINTSI